MRIQYEDYDEDNLNIDDYDQFEEGSEERLNLDNPEELEDSDKKEYQSPEVTGKTLLSVLRGELKKSEADRGSLDFRFDGVNYSGVPMYEINPNKYVFKIVDEDDNQVGPLKSFILSNITVL